MTHDSQTPAGDPTGLDPALLDDAEHNLLSTPIERSFVNRLFVLGGPLSLLIAILVSLWVSWAHVPLYFVVQGDRTWVAGSTRAVRVITTSSRGNDVGRVAVAAVLEQNGQRFELPALQSVGQGIAQGTLPVPDGVLAGPARLHLSAPLLPEPMDEVLELEIVARAPSREPTPMISSLPAQYSDDTGPQPDHVKIDLRAHGRVQTGFDNQFYVRITDAQGRPWEGPIEVVMIKGELDERVATPEQPVTLVRARTNRLGIHALGGALISEILRLRVRVMSRSAPTEETASRTIMLVSFPGAVTVATDRLVSDVGQELELAVTGLSGKRAVYLDVHDATGAWLETLPPVVGQAAPRPWTVPALAGAGLLHFEAYDQMTDPGESTSVAHLQLAHTPQTVVSLRPLIDVQKASLTLPRTDKSFDADRERIWLDEVGAMDLSADEVQHLRRWLIGTLPVTVYGPQTVLSTRARDEAAVLAFKRRWTIGLRWVMLGGGGLFLVAMALVMAWRNANAANKTRAALREFSDEDDREMLSSHLVIQQRTAVLRGIGIFAVMAGALVLAVVMLEALVWQY